MLSTYITSTPKKEKKHTLHKLCFYAVSKRLLLKFGHILLQARACAQGTSFRVFCDSSVGMGGPKLCSVEMVGQQYVCDDSELQYTIQNDYIFVIAD